jgi:hypothetical protein
VQGLQPALGCGKSAAALLDRVPYRDPIVAIGLPGCAGMTGIERSRIENRARRKNIKAINNGSIASHVS